MDDALVAVDFDFDLMHVRLIERLAKGVFRIRSSMTGHAQTRDHRRRTNPEFHERLHANRHDVANDGPESRLSSEFIQNVQVMVDAAAACGQRRITMTRMICLLYTSDAADERSSVD